MSNSPSAGTTLGGMLPPFSPRKALETAFAGTAVAMPSAGEAIRQFDDQVVRSIRSALDVQPVDVLVAAWAKASEVMGAIERTRASNSAVETVELYEHDVTATESAVLDIRIAGIALPEVRFDLDITAHVTALRLDVRGGRITDYDAGEARLSLSLSCQGREVLPEWTSPALPFSSRPATG